MPTIESKIVPTEPDKVDVRCALLAAEQWSVLDVADLRRCGPVGGRHRARASDGCPPEYRGVARRRSRNLTVEGEFLAAVLACGPGAVLSHLLGRRAPRPVEWAGRYPEVTARTRGTHKARSGRTGAQPPRGGSSARGFLVTAPGAQRSIDLVVGIIPTRVCAAGVNEALNRGQIKASDLVTSHHRGAAKLRKILATAAPPATSTRTSSTRSCVTPAPAAGLSTSAAGASSPTSAGPSTA